MSAEPIPVAQRMAATAYSALTLSQLLAEARDLLARDLEAAHRHIDRAAALLQVDGAANDDGGPAFRRGGLAPWQTRRIREHVAARLADRLTTPELAAIAGLSGSYFSTAFRVSFGCSPHAYITQQRVVAAQARMVATNLPLSQIALACGFADQPHFCRQFRRATGLTPADWRRRHAVALTSSGLAHRPRIDRPIVQGAGRSDKAWPA